MLSGMGELKRFDERDFPLGKYFFYVGFDWNRNETEKYIKKTILLRVFYFLITFFCFSSYIQVVHRDQ